MYAGSHAPHGSSSIGKTGPIALTTVSVCDVHPLDHHLINSNPISLANTGNTDEINNITVKMHYSMVRAVI